MEIFDAQPDPEAPRPNTRVAARAGQPQDQVDSRTRTEEECSDKREKRALDDSF